MGDVDALGFYEVIRLLEGVRGRRRITRMTPEGSPK